MSNVIVIDFGASSGRVMVGTLERSKVSLKEYHRFPNSQVIRDSQSCWDLNTILEEIERDISKVLASGVEVDSLGIDTYPAAWGSSLLGEGVSTQSGGWLSETAMYRVKQLLGGKLSLRNYNAQVGETYAMIKALNKLTGIGMSETQYIV